MKFVQVITTVGKESEAREISKLLLEKRLAACVQIFPIESSYRWNGKIENSEEWVCIAKARDNDFIKIETTIRSVHKYSVPEIIAVPIAKGSKPYLTWLLSETKRK